MYEDWKFGNISEDEYKEYSISYTDSIGKMQENIQHIQEELEKFNKNDNNSIWIDKFTKYKNITELSKEVVDELIDDIYVHEGKEITIKFKYEDEYQKAIDYIKRNENITLLNNDEKIVWIKNCELINIFKFYRKKFIIMIKYHKQIINKYNFVGLTTLCRGR